MNKWGKRILSLLVAGVMTISSAFVSYAEDVIPGYSATVTDGYIVAQNYDVLTDAEKTIIMNAGVAGDTLTFTAPSNANLVTVDPVEKTVTAEAYTDAYSNEWEAVTAYVVEGTKTTVIDNFANGSGSFGTFVETENYTIQVKYQLTKELDETAQKKLLNTPYYLVTAIKDFESLAEGKDAMNEMIAKNNAYVSTGYGNNIIQLLKNLADGNMKYSAGGMTATVKIKNDDATIQAINDLYTETKNGTQNMKIVAYIEDYIANYRVDQKQAYAAGTEGQKAAAQALDTYTKLNTIVEGEGMAGVKNTLSDLADWGIEGTENASIAMNGLMSSLKQMRDAIAATILEDITAAQGLMKNVADMDMTAAIDVVLSGEGSVALHNDVTVTTVLPVAATYISSNVNRHDVKVTIKAYVVDDATINSNTTTELSSKTITLQLNNGTSYDALIDAIEANGIEVNALTGWSKYSVNEDNYIRQTTELTNVTEDVDFVITYQPKKFTLTIKDNQGSIISQETVKYGYNLQLATAEEGKSYDYAVDESGYIYQQGDKVEITKDTTVYRREGKEKTSERLLNILVTDYADTLSSDAKSILLNAAVKSDYVTVPVPGDDDNLITLTNDGMTGTITAKDYETGITGMAWKAVGYKTMAGEAVIKTYDISQAEFDMTGVDSVKVDYELVITHRDNSDTVGISDKDVVEFLNIPYSLVEEAKIQKSNMAKLVSQLSNLARGSEIRTFLNSLYGDETALADTKERVDFLRKNCFDGNVLYLYTWVSNYSSNGLSVYYGNEGGYKDIETQVNYLKEHLPIITADPACVAMGQNSAEIADALGKLDNILAVLQALTFPAPNENINFDANESDVANLIEILNKSDKTGADKLDVTKYAKADGITKSTTINKTVEGKVIYTFTVNGYDADGMAVAKKYEKTYDLNYVLTANDIADLETKLADLTAAIDTVHYEEAESMMLPKAGDTVGMPKNFTSTWVLKKFSAYVEDENGIQTLLRDDITYADRTVTLPAATSGYKYIYTIEIDGVKEVKEVLATAGSYTIAKDAFDKAFKTGTFVISRANVNVSVEETVNFADTFNSKLGAGGITETKVLLLENDQAEGTLAMVLRISTADLTGNGSTLVAALGETIIKEAYVGMNGDTFWTTDGDGGIYLQALIDALLESGIGMNSLTELIQDDGTVTELTLDNYTLLNGKDESLGGKVAQIDLNLDNVEMPLYITISNSNPAQLASLEDKILKIQPWINANANAGTLDVVINDNSAEEKVIELLLTGLLLLEDYNTLDDITDVELAAVLKYFKEEKLDPIFTDTAMSYDTIVNTLQSAGITADLSGYKNLIEKALHAAKIYQDYITITLTNGTESYQCKTSVDINIQAVLKKLVEQGTLDSLTAGQIKDQAIVMDINLESADLRDNVYEAIIVDNSKAGSGKFDIVKDGAAAIKAAGNNAVVVLLDDIEADLTVNNGISLNLNGHTVNGAVINTSANAVNIIDSALEKAGTVTGDLTGNFKVTAGTYTNGISTDMLAGGYIMDGNTVKNAVYTLTEETDGNITVLVDATFIQNAKDTEVRDFALDLGVKLALNYYTWANLNVDGCGAIYDVVIEDALSMLKDSKSDIVNTAIDLFNLEGIRLFANKLIEDFSDFAGLAASIEKGEAFACYTFTTSPWDVLASIQGADSENYIAFGVSSNKASVKSGKISFAVTGTEEQKESAAAVLKELDKIFVEKTAVIDTLSDIRYVDGALQVEAHATVNIEVDLTEDERYTTIIGVVLAYQNRDNTALVEGLHAWVNAREVDGMKKALESMPLKNIISSLKASRGVAFGTMLQALDITDNEAAELEAVYHSYLNAAYVMLVKMDITGNDSTLPKYVEEGKVLYGTYGITKTNWKKTDIDLKVKMFTAVPKLTVTVKADNSALYGWQNPSEDNIIYVDLKDAENGIAGKVNGVDEFFNQLVITVTNGKYKMHEYTYTTNSTNSLIGTGTVLSITAENEENGSIITEDYTIVVLGDVNGNGTLDVADMSLIHQHLLAESDKQLDGLAFAAADYNCDDEIEVADVVLVHRRKLDLTLVEASGAETFLPLTK